MPLNARRALEKGLQACFLQSDKERVSILVALSGGADSVALLHLLSERAEKDHFLLAACHVNHGIRGEEADRDEAFCYTLCQKMQIPLYTVRVDVPLVAKANKKGLEETARELRYDALGRLKNELGFDFIATAHHAEDHLETVLFHLARGCGTEGLFGILPMRGDLIRPLLHCQKKDLLSYLSHIGQPFCTDSTNEDTDITRNYIRKVLLPGLQHINPNVAHAFLTTSEILRKDDAFICSFLPKETSDLSVLSSLSDPVLARVLRREYQNAGGKGLQQIHVQSLVQLIRQGETGKRICLPCGISAVREKSSLSFVKTKDLRKDSEVCKQYPIFQKKDIESSEECHIVWIESKKESENTQKVNNLSIKAEVSSAILSHRLFWRMRLPGDSIRIGGMTRKIKKLLWQTGMNIEARDCLPIVCDENGPLWVPGFAVRDDLLPIHGDKVTLCYLPKH